MKDYEYDSVHTEPHLWNRCSVWYNGKTEIGYKHVKHDMYISGTELLEIFNDRQWKALGVSHDNRM